MVEISGGRSGAVSDEGELNETGYEDVEKAEGRAPGGGIWCLLEGVKLFAGGIIDAASPLVTKLKIKYDAGLTRGARRRR